MLKRLFPCLLIVLLWMNGAAAEDGFTVVPQTLHPGKSERISFQLDNADTVTLSLLDENGDVVTVLRQEWNAMAGANNIIWDGLTENGEAPEKGSYQLLAEGENTAFTADITLGSEAPQIISIYAPSVVNPGDVWMAEVNANMPGTLSMRIRMADGQWHTFMEQTIQQGESTHSWNGMVDGAGIPLGTYDIQLQLTDAEGYTGTAQQISLKVEGIPTPTPVPTATPAPTPRVIVPSAIKTTNDPLSYWTLPVEEMNEAAIWEVMMQPMVVIEGGQKEQYPLRKTPDDSKDRDNVVGEITCASQGVHVIEQLDNGWTLVEAYNSSYGERYNKKGHHGFGNTDDLIQGYVKTSMLKTVEPKPEYGLLIDKLYQKMYIFSDGKCIGELLVSTGLNNDEQPWNETPSGEYFMISRMGGFPAGNLWCAYGMRINNGCAIHEVPYIGDHETPASRRDYSSTVKLLGKKASHGCVRVQKDKNEQGQNIKWLWDNIKVGTKVLIWDDTGRFMPYPDDNISLYRNQNGGKYYHEDQNCSSVKERYLPLTEFKYSELDTLYTRLSPCPSCARILRKTEIDEINRQNGFTSVATRELIYPSDDMPLYLNPNGGKYYHEDQYCSSVKSRYLPLTEFKYSQLDSEYAKLKPCDTCAQVMRKSEIDKINKENGY